MKIVIVATMLLAGLYSVAGAQEATPSPIPTPTETPLSTASPAPVMQVPQRFWLEVDAADLGAISQALNELPKRVADPLILKLNSQLQAQQQITSNKAEAEKAKKGKK